MRSIHRLVHGIPWVIVVCGATAAGLLLVSRFQDEVLAQGQVRIERYQVIRASEDGRIVRVRVEPGTPVQRGTPLLDLENETLSANLLDLERELERAERLLASQLRESDHLQRTQPLEERSQRTEIVHDALDIEHSSVRVRETQAHYETVNGRLATMQELYDAGLISSVELARAHSETVQAEARLQQSQIEEEQRKTSKLSTQQELDLLFARQAQHWIELDRQIDASRFEIRRLETEASRLRQRIDNLVLRADLDGVVAGLAGLDLLHRQVVTGEEIVVVIDPRAVVFEGKVSEAGLVKIRTGQRATVEVVGLPKREFDVFPGEVEKVSLRAEVESAEHQVVYPVAIRLEQPWVVWEDETFFLRDGMRGRARIIARGDLGFWRRLSGLVANTGPASPAND